MSGILDSTLDCDAGQFEILLKCEIASVLRIRQALATLDKRDLVHDAIAGA